MPYTVQVSKVNTTTVENVLIPVKIQMNNWINGRFLVALLRFTHQKSPSAANWIHKEILSFHFKKNLV